MLSVRITMDARGQDSSSAAGQWLIRPPFAKNVSVAIFNVSPTVDLGAPSLGNQSRRGAERLPPRRPALSGAVLKIVGAGEQAHQSPKSDDQPQTSTQRHRHPSRSEGTTRSSTTPPIEKATHTLAPSCLVLKPGASRPRGGGSLFRFMLAFSASCFRASVCYTRRAGRELRA